MKCVLTQQAFTARKILNKFLTLEIKCQDNFASSPV